MYWFFYLLIGGLALVAIANFINYRSGERTPKRRNAMALGIAAAFVIGAAGYFANADVREAAIKASEAAAKADQFAKFVNALHWGGRL
ncbi:MAG TPA: hypothetical protein VEK82_02350 [Stellaceae bacterium]|nr:hypothetical protein [Stellaceae bacterium]